MESGYGLSMLLVPFAVVRMTNHPELITELAQTVGCLFLLPIIATVACALLPIMSWQTKWLLLVESSC